APLGQGLGNADGDRHLLHGAGDALLLVLELPLHVPFGLSGIALAIRACGPGLIDLRCQNARRGAVDIVIASCASGSAVQPEPVLPQRTRRHPTQPPYACTSTTLHSDLPSLATS